MGSFMQKNLLSIVPFLSQGAREDSSPFSLREGKLERPKRRDASKGQHARFRRNVGGENPHKMAHPLAQKWANLQPLYHLDDECRFLTFRSKFHP
jgi:hypothetical protein